MFNCPAKSSSVNARWAGRVTAARGVSTVGGEYSGGGGGEDSELVGVDRVTRPHPRLHSFPTRH